VVQSDNAKTIDSVSIVAVYAYNGPLTLNAKDVGHATVTLPVCFVLRKQQNRYRIVARALPADNQAAFALVYLVQSKNEWR
jgi:hypothetical protein